jgi:hypothetical protein
MWTGDRLLGLRSNSIPSNASLVVVLARRQSSVYLQPGDQVMNKNYDVIKRTLGCDDSACQCQAIFLNACGVSGLSQKAPLLSLLLVRIKKF